MKTILFSAIALFVAQDISAQCWNLIWSDEFTGRVLDRSKWTAVDDPQSVSAVGVYPWDVQLLRSDLSLKKSHRYRISFWAKAGVDAKILNCSVLNATNYSQLGFVSASLITSWQYFSTSFIPSASQTGLLTFDFGTQTGVINLDNVALVDSTR